MKAIEINKTKKETNEMTTNELRPQDINAKPWYKKASLPWMIIILATTLFVGIVIGTIMTHNQEDQIRAEASNMMSSLSKTKQ